MKSSKELALSMAEPLLIRDGIGAHALRDRSGLAAGFGSRSPERSDEGAGTPTRGMMRRPASHPGSQPLAMTPKNTIVPQPRTSRLPQIVKRHEDALLADWMTRRKSATTLRADLLRESDLREQSAQFLAGFSAALQSDERDVGGDVWKDVRDGLADLSRVRARLGFSPVETARFIFSLKEPLYAIVRREIDDPSAQVDELWGANLLLDALGLFTTECYQKGREEVIFRQQQELLELSTPVVTLWTGVLALPLIGTLDSARTQVVMESLLQRIAESGSEIAIIDITGVPTVDTVVAQHLMKTVSAARLMGAECIISGIRPQIAQTIVHLGVELGTIQTKATLADAFAIALERSKLCVTPAV